MDEGQDGSVFVDSSIIASPFFRAFATGPLVEAAVAARGSIFYVEIAPIQSVLTSATSLHPTRSSISFRPIIRRSHYGPRISLSKKIVVMIVTMIFFIIFEWNDKNDFRLDFPHSKISLEIFSFFLKNIFRFTAAILQF